ncbi:MAG: hypothetical protein J6Q18_01955 [Oscillospiraceae bacterium]|nr:hypothetical protein [Oscillospiraceae bacterium]
MKNDVMMGVTVVQTASTISSLLDWLLPIALVLIGFTIIKKSKSKKIKTTGTLIATAGFLMLLWMIFWHIFALLII